MKLQKLENISVERVILRFKLECSAVYIKGFKQLWSEYCKEVVDGMGDGYLTAYYFNKYGRCFVGVVKGTLLNVVDKEPFQDTWVRWEELEIKE